ncbi:MAG: hypothetical protein ACRC33_19205 [Gemmataceae bacterium]
MIRTILLASALVAAAGCSDGARTKTSILSGQVTVDGKAVGETTLIVTGPDGKQAGGNTSATGEYKIPDPPVGTLEFHFMPAPATAAGPKIPAKYTQPKNGLTVQYKGGDQVEDLKLKS